MRRSTPKRLKTKMVENNQEKIKDDLEKLANSKEFRILERRISEANPRFEDLDFRYKVTAIYLLRTGNLSMMEGLNNIFYLHQMKTIDEFLTFEVIGQDARDLFPKWRQVLLEQFSPENQVYELIVSGSIGSGKTSLVNLAQMYNLYRVCCLRYPQLSLGAGQNRPMFQSLFSVTLDKAKIAVLAPYMNQIKQCNLFQEVKHDKHMPDVERTGRIPYVNHGRYVQFPRGITVQAGSIGRHALSLDLFGAVLDEAEFRISGIEDAMHVYTQLKERVASRFLGSRFVLVCLVSSAKFTTGIISEYLKGINPATSTESRYLAYPIWEVKEFDAYKRGSFYVMRGTKTHPSRILNKHDEELYLAGNFNVPSLCEIIKVPLAYKPNFLRRIDEAIRNIAGVQTIGGERLFDDTTRMEMPWLRGEFNLEAPLVYETSAEGDPSIHIPLIQRLPQDLFEHYPGGKRFSRYPTAGRYLHLDNAEASEGGLCILHKELDAERDVIVYVVDLLCWITSPNRISLDDVARLVVDLHEKCDVEFEVTSTDQYQSSHTRQLWESQRISKEIKHLSVDKTIVPYECLSKIVDSNCLAIGKAPKARGQLESVEINDANKIYSMERKDMADAVCGAVYNALMNVHDQPIYYYGVEKKTATTAEVLEGFVKA